MCRRRIQNRWTVPTKWGMATAATASLVPVATARNGLDAIELADELEPEAIVIDLHMPLVDGVTAVARLRKDHPNVCLIALTGDPDRNLHEAVAAAGADAVLQKDTLVDTLVDRLAAVRTPAPSS